MAAYLNAVASSVPATCYRQERILDVMKAWHRGDRRTERILDAIYRASAIDKRHSTVRDFVPGDPGGFFYDPEARCFLVPGTGARNRLYRQEAGPLAARAAGGALTAGGIRPGEVTHLITASCTGFFAPGPDIELVDSLALDPAVERFHIGFMGCYAAFPALRMARAFCLADPAAVVLVVSVELCTLHLQPAADVDSLLAASVFADGAAAALVSSREPAGAGLRLDAFSSALARESADEMAWTIGDNGFEMVLSSRLPEVVEQQVEAALEPLLERQGSSLDEVNGWAVHPGGRAILDRVERALALPDDALGASRGVLAEFGNMSSATILFILERLLRSPGSAGDSLVAIAFGPGLTVESAHFTRSG
jgi:predicted naringenin-chalcone synthase